MEGGIRGSRGMKGGEANEVSLHSPLRSGEGGISPPRPPLLFSVILEKGKNPLLQTFTPLSHRVRRMRSKQWETYSHPKSHQLKSEFRKEFWKMSLEGGSGETCSPKVSPETGPLLSKPKVGLEGGLRITHFHPPDCGGVFLLQLFFAYQRKVGKRK